MEELMPAGVAAPGETGEGPMIAGSDEARFIRGFGIGAVGAFHSGHNIPAHFFLEQLQVKRAFFIVIIVSGEHHNERLGNARFDHVVQSVFCAFVPNEAVLRFVGAMVEVNDIIPLLRIFAVSIGKIHPHVIFQFSSIHFGGVGKAGHSTRLLGRRVIEFGVVLAEYRFKSGDIVGGDHFLIIRCLTFFCQRGNSIQRKRKDTENNQNTFHHSALHSTSRKALYR